MTKDYLTIEQTAKKLGLSYKTVFRYIQSKKLEATKVGHWRINKIEIEEFLKRNSNLRNK